MKNDINPFTFFNFRCIIYITKLCFDAERQKMTAKKFFYALFFLFALAFVFSSCSGGSELCRVEGEDYTYVLYGSPNAIRSILLIDPASGQQVAEIELSYRVNEPWLAEDKENYGFAICDLDGDGDEDFTVKKNRTSGAEKYLFYLNKGNGEFKLQEKLSGVEAPVFGDGTVRYKTASRVDTPTSPHEPPVYELREDEHVYGWSEHGRLEIRELRRLSYFSETDIYRYAIFLPGEDGELESAEERWIPPEKLAEEGFLPLE
jgi:hypothetical protein